MHADAGNKKLSARYNGAVFPCKTPLRVWFKEVAAAAIVCDNSPASHYADIHHSVLVTCERAITLAKHV